MNQIRHTRRKVFVAPMLPSLPDPQPFDVVGFGENSVDFVSTVATWPEPDSKQRLVAFDRLPGGQIATAAAVCARLGCRTRYAGVFGDDEAGRWVATHLESLGIDVVAAVVAGAATRTASILVGAADGRRTILEYRDPRLAEGFARLPREVFTSGRVLMLDATDLDGAVEAATLARAAGVRVVLDVDTADEALAPLLACADILITSATVPQELTGAATVEQGLRQMAERSPAALVVATLGAAGSVALSAGQVLRTPALAVDVVDTTGAGDAFRAGFVAGWLRAPGAPDVEILLRQANIAAGLSCRGRGAQGAVPTWHEIERECNRGS
jgi:sugar/nucleoside kinase (ribokinase family)